MTTGSILDDILNGLQDTIKEPEFEEREFALLPNGRHTMGLVNVKNIIMHSKQTNEDSPGYQLTFRGKDKPDAYVNHKMTAKVGRGARLIEVLQNMTDGRLSSKPTHAEAFECLKKCFNAWYSVVVKQNPWTSADGKQLVFVNVQNNAIFPKEGAETWEPPLSFFAKLDAEKTSPDFKGYTDATPEMKQAVEDEDDEIPF